MKRILIAALLLVVAGSFAFAQTIGENFEGDGGIVVGGSGRFYTDLNGYVELGLYPWADLLLADGLAVGSGVSLFFNNSRYFSVGVSPNASYYFAYDPDADSGLAHRASLATNVTFWANSGTNGLTISLTPYYRLYYFLNPRIAAYGDVSIFRISISNGFSIPTFINLGFGISFHMPNRDKLLSSIQQ